MAASSSAANECTEEENDPISRFTRYNIIIGQGSTKTVYKGFDHLYGTEIAWSKIKLSPEKEKTKENLEKLCEEPKLLMSLDHENITKCYGYWIDEYENVVNTITEYCSSGNLAMYCKENVRNLVGNTAIKNWCRQILNALHYLHTLDSPVTHCDINGKNIFVKGNTSTIKLGDFGLAMVFESGTKPELVTDVYLFGLSITHMVSIEKVRFIELICDSNFRSIALSGVTDPQIQQFLRNTVIAPPKGPTAMDLLVNDPFLAVDNKVAESSNANSSSAAAGILNVRGCVQDQVDRLLLPPKEVIKEIEIENRKIRLQGIMSDYVSNSINMKLIIDGNDTVRTIDFEFILGIDTISDIMKNMNLEFDLFLADEVKQVSQIMKRLVKELQDALHDSNTPPSIADEEDWYLQDLFFEETSDGAPSTDEASNDTQDHSNRSQHNQQDVEQQQMQSGWSDDNNRRRGNSKLSSCLCCKKF